MLLLNIKELKNNNFWNEYINNRNFSLRGIPEQTLLNIIIPDDKKGYLPLKFGGFSFLIDYNNSDNLIYDLEYENWINSELDKDFSKYTKNHITMINQIYNSAVIHKIIDKCNKETEISIDKHLIKYFIKLGDIRDEFCEKKSCYCV